MLILNVKNALLIYILNNFLNADLQLKAFAKTAIKYPALSTLIIIGNYN